MRLGAVAIVMGYLVLSGAVAWVGLSVPMHFRAVSPLVLAEAGEGTPTAEELGGDFLSAGQTGPAAMVLAAAPGAVRLAEQEEILRELLRQHPQYRLSGGPAPYFEQWLTAAQIEPAGEAKQAVLPVLLPRERRQHLSSFLEQSSNRTVQALLATRALSGYERFLPVFSAGGHPLEATILATALLEQSDVWSPEISRFLRDRALAADTDSRALAELEQIYLAVLSLGSRLNWTQLTVLLGTVPTVDVLHQVNAAAQLAEERLPELYTGILLAKTPGALAEYLLERGEDGWRVMEMALPMGAGALTTMVDFNQPLYDAPDFLKALHLSAGQARLRGFTQQQPRLALFGKALALILAGYFLALALEGGVRLFLPPHPHPRGPVVHLFHLVTGVGLAALVWMASEPKLLEFAPNEGGTLRIQLANLMPLAQAEGSEESSTMLDQVTLLVLLLFLVLQGIVFIFCVIKIKEIRGQPVSAAVKLRLLDNEENLFDLGLYVGLGGTVASLLLVVMELVDASLMAAYASTLFGIIFVAVLKVMILRPYRRRLIIEANQAVLTA